MKLQKKIIWDSEKNNLLVKTRGIGFEEVANQMRKNEILATKSNPSKNHKNQKIIIFRYNDYIWNCPCLIEKDKIILKTIFPNRKHNALYS